MPDFHLTITFSSLFIIIAAALAGILAVYGYRYTLPPVAQSLRISLLVLRGLGLFLLFLLLGEPLLSLIAHRSEKPVLAVLIDQSRSLTIRDKAGDRKETMIHTLHAPVFDQVRKTSDLVYAVFDSKTRLLQSLADDSISFQGEETDLGGALRALRTEGRQLNLRAVLVLSDGNSTSGSSPLFEAEELGLPVSTVGIGDTSIPQDIQIHKTSSMGMSYIGTKTPVDVTVRSSGFANERVEVSLLEGGSVRDRKTVVLEPGVRQYEVPLAFLPEAEGTKKITVEVSQLPGEISTQNNRASFYVKVLKSKMRVVAFASAPSPDLSAFRQALQADANVELKLFVERGGGQFYNGALTSQDFREADCLALVGFPGVASPDPLLREIVDQVSAGKGVLFMMSRAVDFRKLGMLQSYLPFTIPQQQGEETQTFFVVSESQRGNAVMRTLPLQDVWSRLPPVFIPEEAARPKPESAVLASGRTPMIPGTIPLLLSRRVNRAKSLAFTCYGVWRWQTYAEGIPGAEKLLENLLSNGIRWLVTREDERPVRIRPTKEIYSGSEPVEFTAQVYDDNYTPIDDAEVSVLVSRKGETSQLTLTPLGNGRLEGVFGPLPEGDYMYTARAMLGGTELATEGGSFTVGGLNAEFLETRMNKSLLQQLAARTGGTYYDPVGLSRLPADLEALPDFRTRNVSTARSLELWNTQWMLALLVALFSVEWFLRKRNGMM